MNRTTACQCMMTVTVLIVGVQLQATAAVVSGSRVLASAPGDTQEVRKPATPGTANRDGTAAGTAPAGKMKQAPMPRDRAREVEERVRSGQMEQPIAQGEISERLNQLESGSKGLSDEATTSHPYR
jgi:hypothetical protein